MSTAAMLPSFTVCERARRSRDRRFDGLFFIGVPSTRIYCRTVCPAPEPRRVVYFPTAAAADAGGYRPCLRCRPELAPGRPAIHRGDAAVARALQLIERGDEAAASIETLARRLGVGARQLRRQFHAQVGAAPLAVRNTRRLLFAKQLLADTGLAIAAIAKAAGFGSLRRFNAAFRGAYRMTPRDVRGARRTPQPDAMVLWLETREPYDADWMLEFLARRAIPGLEHVAARSYARVLRFDDDDGPHFGALRVEFPAGGGHRLKLELQDVPLHRLLDVVGRVRRMFDLDADPFAIRGALARDARLAPLARRWPGLRLPSGWDGFEIAVRAVLGQQVTVAAGRTLVARVARRYGTPVPRPVAPELEFAFPTPARLARATFAGLGLLPARAAALRRVAVAVQAGTVGFAAEQGLERFVAQWCELDGVGPWTAHYLALRGLGHPDAFPSGDVVLQDALGTRSRRATAAEIERRAAAWRPWRSYATLLLWREAMERRS